LFDAGEGSQAAGLDGNTDLIYAMEFPALRGMLIDDVLEVGGDLSAGILFDDEVVGELYHFEFIVHFSLLSYV